MKEIAPTLRHLGFGEIRPADADEFEPLNGQLPDGCTTDELNLILRPNDRDGIAHIRNDGDLLAVARKSER